jgi:hypothetical protein
MQQKIHLLSKVADSGMTCQKNCVQTQISTLSKQLSKPCILKAINKPFNNVFLSLYSLFNLYYFECMHDIIYEAESALCNINKHHLQLKIVNPQYSVSSQAVEIK